MINALRSCDLDSFTAIAQPYHVGYVVTATGGETAQAASSCAGVELRHQDPYASVLSVPSAS